MTIQVAHSNMVRTLAKPGQDIVNGMDRSKLDVLLTAVKIAVAACALLDQAKRYAIYNKEVKLSEAKQAFHNALTDAFACQHINYDVPVSMQLTADKAHLLHMAIGVCGEGGEILEEILLGCAPTEAGANTRGVLMDNVLEETGDLEFFLEGIRQALAINRDESLDHNLHKLTKGPKARYKEGVYSDAAAQARADKEPDRENQTIAPADVGSVDDVLGKDQ